MMNSRLKVKREQGITLIALIVMIVILVILAAVVIRGITGNEGLIKSTEIAAEDYNITSYKEQVEQQVRGIIIKHATIGKEISETEIADELDEETIWITFLIFFLAFWLGMSESDFIYHVW